MKLFTVTDHDHVYPVGVASIVVAETEEQAIELLDEALKDRNLNPRSRAYYTLVEVDTSKPQALVLRDGDY